MIRTRLSLCLALLLPVSVQAGEPASVVSTNDREHAAHAAHDAHATASDPAPATRWPADAPLSRGMGRVRAATSALAHGEHGHLDAGQVQAIATELRLAVDDMFANCRLDPAPDAALHPLLARVLGASRALSGGSFDAAALAELRAVLARYPQLFEDATWRPLAVLTRPAPAAAPADGAPAPRNT